MEKGTILILHGWGSSKEKWEKVKKGLEKRGFEVLVPDLPGFKKANELKEAWRLDDYFNWVKGFSEGIDKPFYILGQSFGGGLALKYAASFPEDLSGLVLVSAAVFRLKGKKVARMVKAANFLSKFSFVPGYELLRKFLYYHVLKRPDYVAAEGALKETFENIIEEDLSHFLSKVRVPTLLIWGEKDKVTPVFEAKMIKERIRGSKLEVLEGVGHAPHLEAPERLVDKLIGFLE